MIAKNYIKYPEALRFQCEMFSNGYHNSPRIMRLVEVVFNWTPSIPAWWQALKNAENLLIKGWRKMQYELFGKTEIVAKSDLETTIENFRKSTRWTPTLKACSDDQNMMHPAAGRYRSFCQAHQGGYQGWAKIVGNHLAYSNTNA